MLDIIVTPGKIEIKMKTKKTKNHCPLCNSEGNTPNEETAKVLKEVDEGKNLKTYKSTEEMFREMGI